MRSMSAPLQIKYSNFVHGLKQENIQLNRKVLSQLAMQEPLSFKALVDQVRFMRGMGAHQQQQATTQAS